MITVKSCGEFLSALMIAVHESEGNTQPKRKCRSVFFPNFFSWLLINIKSHMVSNFRGPVAGSDLHSVWEGGKEWNGMKKEEEYFRNILFFPLFGSLSRREWKGMERPFSCLRV